MASAVKHPRSQVHSLIHTGRKKCSSAKTITLVNQALCICFNAMSDVFSPPTATVERLAHHMTEPRDSFSPHTRALLPECSVLCPYSQGRGSKSSPQTENNCPMLHMPWSTCWTKGQNMLPWQHSTEITVLGCSGKI